MFEAIKHIINCGDNLLVTERKIDKHASRVVEITETITSLKRKEVVDFEEIDKREKELHKYTELCKQWKRWKSKIIEELNTLNNLECGENVIDENRVVVESPSTEIPPINIVANCEACINHEGIDYCPFGLKVINGKCDMFC